MVRLLELEWAPTAGGLCLLTLHSWNFPSHIEPEVRLCIQIWLIRGVSNTLPKLLHSCSSPSSSKKRNKEFFLFWSLGCRLKYYIYTNFQHAISYFIKPWHRKYIECLPDSSPAVLLLTLGTYCRARNIPSPHLAFDSSLLLWAEKKKKKKKEVTAN